MLFRFISIKLTKLRRVSRHFHSKKRWCCHRWWINMLIRLCRNCSWHIIWITWVSIKWWVPLIRIHIAMTLPIVIVIILRSIRASRHLAVPRLKFILVFLLLIFTVSLSSPFLFQLSLFFIFRSLKFFGSNLNFDTFNLFALCDLILWLTIFWAEVIIKVIIEVILKIRS